MPHAREHLRPSTAKASRHKSEAVRSDATGQFLLMQAGEAVAEVPVSKARFERIVRKPRVVGKMISGYADAALKAKRTGLAYVIAYRVTPDGKAAVVETPAADPLDAALAKAKARGAVKATEILKGADMLTARAFGPLIGASHETVNVKRKRGEVLGLEGSTRGVKYPRWQVTEEGLPLPGLTELFAVLGEQPWTVYRFLKAAHAELGGQTALDALKRGKLEAVVGAARNQAAGVFA